MATRTPSTTPHRAAIPASHLRVPPPGRVPHPPIHLQNGGEGTGRPHPQVGDARLGGPPVLPGLTDPKRLQSTGYRAARAGNDWAAASRAAKLPTPHTSATTYRASNVSDAQTGPAAPTATNTGHEAGVPVQTAALHPEPPNPGRDRAPATPSVPVPPPRGGRLLRCVANPSPQSRGLTNTRPAPARKAHLLVPSRRIGEGPFSGSRPSPLLLALATLAPFFSCAVGSCEGALSGAARRDSYLGTSFPACRLRPESGIHSFVLRHC